jgi:hypothetical protein
MATIRSAAAHGLRLLVAGCEGCQHEAGARAEGKCDPQDACVRAMSGRLIDRFMRRNPELAASYLEDPFWERRAIACRHAPIELLEPRVTDRDEVVRRVVAYRAPEEWLTRMIQDSDRDVRIIVAEHLPPDRLGWAALDADYRVRLVAAQRMSSSKLLPLAGDPDREVRKAVARRLPSFALDRMMGDADPEVRRAVCERLAPAQAAAMLDDEEWTVRFAAVERAPLEDIERLAESDPEQFIRETALARLQAARGGKAAGE